MRYYNFLKLVTEAQNRSNIIIGIIVSKTYAPAGAKKEGIKPCDGKSQLPTNLEVLQSNNKQYSGSSDFIDT